MTAGTWTIDDTSHQHLAPYQGREGQRPDSEQTFTSFPPAPAASTNNQKVLAKFRELCQLY
jgi:hypothetical protein